MKTSSYTMYDDRPVSYNNPNKAAYERKIRKKFIDDYKNSYYALPLTTTLESRIVYYSRVQREEDRADIDNISKPTIDAFTGCIYKDDKQVIQRIASRYDLDPLEIISIDCSNMPYAVMNDINQCIQSKSEHLLICSFAPIDRKDLMEA